MKFILKILICLFVTLPLLIPEMVFAHSIGQPSFFKINGKYANLYPVPLVSISDFDLPQDLAPENYLVNQAVNFELDTTKLQVPSEVIAKTRFAWEFGDGQKAEGLKNIHIYSKMGSYLLKIFADDKTTPTPQLLELVLINALPDKNYQLPQAIIKVNGQTSRDPLTDILKIKFDGELNFDASLSSAPSSKIVSYFWDFGNQKTSDKPITTQAYAKDLTQVFPVLRIKDANGFISDSYIEIENGYNSQNTFKQISGLNTKKSSTHPSQLKYLLIASGLTILGVLIWRKFLKKKSKLN